MLLTQGMSPARTAITEEGGNGLPKFDLQTLRTIFEKASQNTWTYKRPYNLVEWNVDKNYEQALERIDDIEAGRI